MTITREGSGDGIYYIWNPQANTPVGITETYTTARAAVGAEETMPVAAGDSKSGQGTLTCTITWIGSGPPPPKVLVRLTADVEHPVEGSGDAGVPITYVGGNQDGVQAGGELYRLLDMNGGSAQTTIQGSVTCTVNWPAGQGKSGTAAWSSNAYFAPRALGISTSNVPTYHRAYSLAGVVYQQIDDTSDLNERTMTMGYSLSNFGDQLVGSLGFTADANLVGDWVAPVTGQWSGGGLSTFEDPSGTSASVNGTASQGQLLALSVADSTTNGNVSVSCQEVYPRSNGQTLPGMNSKLNVKMHAPAGYISIREWLHTGTWVPLKDLQGNVIYATVFSNQTQSYTTGSSFTATHFPTTLTVSPAIGPKLEEFLNLKLSGSIAIPMDTQDAYQTLANQTFSITGSTPEPKTYQLVAKEVWEMAAETYALYGLHGFEGDSDVEYAKKDTYGLTHWWRPMEEN